MNAESRTRTTLDSRADISFNEAASDECGKLRYRLLLVRCLSFNEAAFG